MSGNYSLELFEQDGKLYVEQWNEEVWISRFLQAQADPSRLRRVGSRFMVKTDNGRAYYREYDYSPTHGCFKCKLVKSELREVERVK